MTYKVFFKNGSPATIEGVDHINFNDEEYVFYGTDGVLLSIVSKSEYECILKVK